MSSPVQAARNRLGNASQRKNKVGNPAGIIEARRDLAAAKLDKYITETVAAAPPLTDEQRARLALLLLGTSDGA